MRNTGIAILWGLVFFGMPLPVVLIATAVVIQFTESK